VGSFIRIGPGIEEGEPSPCGGAPMAVVAYLNVVTLRTRIPKLAYAMCVHTLCTKFSSTTQLYHTFEHVSG
jgi:hypothetical protein